MDSRTVAYTLVAHATGIEEIRAVRTEIEGIAAVRFNFEAQVQELRVVAQEAAKSSAQQQADERARQKSLEASTASMNKLGTAVVDLTARLASMGSKGTAAAGGAKAVDAAVRVAAQGLNTLTNAYIRGGISQSEFVQKGAPMKAYLAGVTNEFGRFSKEASLAERALRAAASSPVTAAFRQQQAAAREMVQTINLVRGAWQSEMITDQQAAEKMAGHQRMIIGTIDALKAEQAALQQKGVLDVAESRRVQELIQLQNTYTQALKATVSVQTQVAGNIQKGSLGAGVRAGVGPQPVPPATTASVNNYANSLKVTTGEVSRLQAAESANLITKTQLATALQAEAVSQRAVLAAIQTEAAALRTLSSAVAAEVARLEQLRIAENEYTQALARTIAAQRQAALGSNRLGAGLGAAGARNAGLGNAAMAASLISPELGMASMLASTGPTVAGFALVALGIKKVIDLTVQGQDEFKKWQQATLVMTANHVQNLDQVNDSLNRIITHGSDAEKMFSKSELATSLAALARGGVKGADGLTVLAVSTQLAAAEHVKLDDATKKLYGNLNHLGLTAADAAGFGDKLARASHLSMASMDELSDGLNIVGVTAHKLGFSTDETLAALVRLGQKGMDPANVGSTGLRNAMQKLEHPTRIMKANFEELGVALVDSNGHARTGHDVMLDLAAAVNATGPVYSKTTGKLLTETDRTRMAFQIFGTRSATAFLGIIEGVKGLTTEIHESRGFLAEYSSTVVGGLEGAQKRLDAATKNLSLSFAQIFTPALTNVVKFVQQGVTTLNDFVIQVADAHSGVEKFSQLKINPEDSSLMVFLKLVHNTVEGVSGAVDTVMQKMKDLSQWSGLHNVGDALVTIAPGLGDDAQRNRLAQAQAKQQIDAAQKQLVELQKELAAAKKDPSASVVHTGNAAGFANAGMFGPVKPGTSRVQDLQTAIDGLTKTLTTSKATLQHLQGTSGVGGGLEAKPGEILPLKTGDRFADNFVDYCAKWVRNSLDTANPKLKRAIDNLFQSNPFKGQDPSADSAKQNFKRAGLLHEYTGIGDLKPGDTVFFDKNHVGTYIGNGMVRGNNRVTYAANGGTYTNGKADNNANPVGDVYIGNLGHVAGFARIGEIATKYGQQSGTGTGTSGSGGHANGSGSGTPPPENNPNFVVKPFQSYLAEAKRLTDAVARYDKGGAQANADKWQLATKALQAFTAQGPLAQNAVSWVSKTTDKVSKFGETFDKLKSQIDVVDNLSKLGTSSTDTLKALDGIRDAANGAAGAEKRRNGETEKYRELLGLAADASSKAKSIRSADAAEAKRIKTQNDQDAAADRAAQAQAAQFEKTLNQQLATGKITQAQATVRAMEAARETDLKGAKGNVQASLKLEQDRGNAILAAQLKILTQQRVQAIQSAHDTAAASRAEADKLYKGKVPTSVTSGIDQTETAAVKTAWSTYGSDSTTAQEQAAGRITDAQGKVSNSVQSLREKYHTLADSICEQTTAGTFDSQAKQKALVEFNQLGREVTDAGLTNDKFLTGARKVTFALVGMGEAAYGIQQRLADSEETLSNLADRAVTASSELETLGDTQGALEGLQAALASVMDAAGRGESVGQAVSTLAAAIAKLQDALDLDQEFNSFVQGLTGSLQDELGQIADKILDPATSARLRAKLKTFQMQFGQDASKNLLQNVVDDNAAAGEQVNTDSTFAASDIDAANHDLVSALFKGPDAGSQATAFLSGPDGMFGAQFWSQLGEQGRAEFTANLSKLAPSDFKGVSSATLKGLIESIGDDPDWAELKKTIQAGLTANAADAAKATNFGDLGELIGKGQGAVDDLNSGKTTAAKYADVINTQLLQALELISSTTKDSDVKTMADKAIEGLKNEGAEAQKLADLFVQAKLAKLDLDKSSGNISEKNYIDSRQTTLTDQENAGYSEKDASGHDLIGQALLVRQREHQAKLTQISTDGDKARADLTLRLQTQTLATQNQLAAEASSFQHGQGLTSDLEFQRAQEAQQAKTVQDAFDLKTKSLEKDSDEYRTEASQLEADLSRIRNQGTTDRAALDLRNQTQTLATQNQRDAENLSFQHDRHLISDAEFQRLQETQQVTGAQSAFALKTKFMKRDSDEYRVEAAQLEVDLTRIRNQGILDRAALDSGQVLLDGQKKALGDLKKSYEQGATGAVEMRAQAIGLAQSLDEQAKSAERAGRADLAGQFRSAAEQARALAGPLGLLAEKMNKWSEYLQLAGEVTGAFGKLTGAMAESEQDYDETGKKLNTPWKDLTANINGAEKALQLAGSMASDVAKIFASGGTDLGSWVHLAVSVIGSIADALGGYKKAQAEVISKQKEFNAQFTLIDGNMYQKTYTRSRGFFADLFGGGPEVVQEIDEVGLKYAKTLESSIVGGIDSGMKEAIAKNDFSLFTKSLKSSIYDGVVQGLIDGFKTDVIKAILAPAIKEWSDALKTPDTSDDDLALSHLDSALSEADAAGQKFYTTITPRLARFKPEEDDSTTTDTSSSFGAVATAGQVAVGSDFLDAATLISSGAVLFRSTITDANAMYKDVISMFRDVLAQGVPVKVDVATPVGQQGSGTGSLGKALR